MGENEILPGSMLNADLCGNVKSESEVYLLPGLAEEMGNIFKEQGVRVLYQSLKCWMLKVEVNLIHHGLAWVIKRVKINGSCLLLDSFDKQNIFYVEYIILGPKRSEMGHV